jgi:hypothetical protein
MWRWCAGSSTPVVASKSVRPSIAMRPRVGRTSPAMACSTEVLPAPDAPTSAIARRVLSMRTLRPERPARHVDVDREQRMRHAASPRRWRCTSHSEQNTAAKDIATATIARRHKPDSPPGTCIIPYINADKVCVSPGSRTRR